MTISAPESNSIDVALPATPELVSDPAVYGELSTLYRAVRSLQAAAGATSGVTPSQPFYVRQFFPTF